jgi:hypothetical protein
MNYSSVLIPRTGDSILFGEYEVKIRSTPNLILSPSGKEPGFIFQFAFSYEDFCKDLPNLESILDFALVYPSVGYPAPVRKLSDKSLIKDLPSVIYMYEPHIIGETYNLYVEELEVHGKFTLNTLGERGFVGMFKAGIMELPCIERAKDVDLERKAAPKCKPTPKPKHGTEYNKFETLDLT